MKMLVACTRRPGTTKVGGDLGQAFIELGHDVAYQDFDDRPFALRFFPKPLRGERYRLSVARAQNQALGPGWTKVRMSGEIRTHPPAFGAMTNEIYNRARINLNIHAWVGRGSAVNLRLFEVPAAGAFLLTDWVDEIADYYLENWHVACYRGLEDLKGKLKHFLARPDECERIAQAGREHLLAYHSYKIRAQRILDHARDLLK